MDRLTTVFDYLILAADEKFGGHDDSAAEKIFKMANTLHDDVLHRDERNGCCLPPLV